ncbi:hypothetical protein ZIOFF_035150 [Zingiber officinale]|uniref:Wbp11/ELF5/Saf1 N-terminal domain-containing protein n=1 Tax=Zingiber officinale TaxID=94328 RepID=A0A8J5GBD8_ZINOF|nr:hypothetical protein ZIOFF_035150 [Zingiber officinale]
MCRDTTEQRKGKGSIVPTFRNFELYSRFLKLNSVADFQIPDFNLINSAIFDSAEMTLMEQQLHTMILGVTGIGNADTCRLKKDKGIVAVEEGARITSNMYMHQKLNAESEITGIQCCYQRIKARSSSSKIAVWFVISGVCAISVQWFLRCWLGSDQKCIKRLEATSKQGIEKWTRDAELESCSSEKMQLSEKCFFEVHRLKMNSGNRISASLFLVLIFVLLETIVFLVVNFKVESQTYATEEKSVRESSSEDVIRRNSLGLDAEILALDEATTAMDVRTDALIQKTIRDKFKSCTMLIVADQLNTIIDCDRLLLLSAGKIMTGFEIELLLSFTYEAVGLLMSSFPWNKKERKKVHEVDILKKDPEAIRKQIEKLERMSNGASEIME